VIVTPLSGLTQGSPFEKLIPSPADTFPQRSGRIAVPEIRRWLFPAATNPQACYLEWNPAANASGFVFAGWGI
jgi:hypothetical protein